MVVYFVSIALRLPDFFQSPILPSLWSNERLSHSITLLGHLRLVTCTNQKNESDFRSNSQQLGERKLSGRSLSTREFGRHISGSSKFFCQLASYSSFFQETWSQWEGNWRRWLLKFCYRRMCSYLNLLFAVRTAESFSTILTPMPI